MSRLCCCMVIVLTLTTFAAAGDMTTRTIFHQLIAGGIAVDDTDAGISEEESKKIEEVTESIEIINPKVNKLISQLLAEIISAKREGGLNVIDQIRIVDMVKITGMPQSKAVDELTQAGLKSVPNVIHDYSSDVPAGHVIKQEPQAGTKIEEDSLVTMVVAKTLIAIQSCKTPTEPLSGEAENNGQLIVHRPFDVQLGNVVQNVPLFMIVSEGLHHPPGEKKYDLLEVRAKCIAQRLGVAWNILNHGGYLEITDDNAYDMPDGLLGYRLSGPFAPVYEDDDIGNAPDMHPAIYVRRDENSTPIRIMTIYPEDAKNFGFPRAENGNNQPTPFSQRELAEYFKALIEAHHTLFFKMSDQIEDYASLEICKTREGKIFKEIYLRAKEVSEEFGGIQDALERIAADQRYRLERLARKAPMDWRVRNSSR